MVHISNVIVAYTLDQLSSLMQNTHNLQLTINRKFMKKTHKSWGHPINWLLIGYGNYSSVYNLSYTLLNPWTEREPHTVIKTSTWSISSHYLDQCGNTVNELIGTNFSQISTTIHTFSFKKMHLKMSSVKWRLYCLSLNVLTKGVLVQPRRSIECHFQWLWRYFDLVKHCC